MSEITEDSKLKLQMTMNPNTQEMEVLITIKGMEDEHGWFFMRKDLINLLAHSKVTVPHAEKAPQIDMTTKLPPGMIKQ